MDAERARGALPLSVEPLTTNDRGGGGFIFLGGVAISNLPVFILQATPIKLSESQKQHQKDMKVTEGYLGKKGCGVIERER